MKGTYLLIIFLHKKSRIKYGKRNVSEFPKGYYIYVGSALGRSGSATLLNRVKRHLMGKNQKQNHWHIDYFLANESTSLTSLYLIPSNIRWECQIAQELLKKASKVIKGFGASDCHCEGHLFYFKTYPAYFL
ncbi:MAG: GIY-YIG nuclease family protein [Candidatus Lokiarchaeota archaeon]